MARSLGVSLGGCVGLRWDEESGGRDRLGPGKRSAHPGFACFGLCLAACVVCSTLFKYVEPASKVRDTVIERLNAPSESSLLPSWPIDNVGDAIPDQLISKWKGECCPAAPGKYAAFPSKGNKETCV
jgi:hypothetical protein